MLVKNWQAHFKFQSDSINTLSESGRRVLTLSFKFQSDSINTTISSILTFTCCPLNSNLILLIPGILVCDECRHNTLNSNLILLIQDYETYSAALLKSLNSNLILLILRTRLCGRCRISSLNSNLILLIQIVCVGCGRVSDPFKFQSDSINTVDGDDNTYVDSLFKFQSDSINTT